MLKAECATPGQAEEILPLLALMHKEGYPGSWSDERALESLNDTLANGLVLITRSEGRIVGTMGLRPQQYDWSNDWELLDRWFFVHPSHRQTHQPHAVTLLEGAKSVAKNLNIPFRPGIFSKHRLAAKVRLFRRVFGDPVGAIFMVEP